jgi:homoserine kinase
LHQDYRSPLFPEAPQLLARLVSDGALASCWSGAGPSLLGICDGADGDSLRTKTEAAMAEIGVRGRAVVLRPDLEGLVIDGGQTGLFDIDVSTRR